MYTVLIVSLKLRLAFSARPHAETVDFWPPNLGWSDAHGPCASDAVSCLHCRSLLHEVETVWIRDLLAEMGMSALIAGPTIMLGDNDQATSLAYMGRQTLKMERPL